MRLLVAGLLGCALLAAPAAARADCGVSGPSRAQAWRAELLARTPVSAHPGGPVRGSLAPDRVGALLVLAVARDAGGRCWLRVRLPARPNDAAGWIAADRVTVSPTPWRIEIGLRQRTVTLLRAGKPVRRYRAVVGASGTPTPRGLFAFTDAYRGRDSDFLGRWVLSLTAHSDVLERFDGGDGRVAVHGRGGASLRDPLGGAASHGCVRLSNPAISGIVRRIGAAAVPGTPVRLTHSG